MGRIMLSLRGFIIWGLTYLDFSETAGVSEICSGG